MHFFSFFKTLIGKTVVVELKNGLMMKGTLVSVDQYHNVKLSDMSVVDADKYPHLTSVSDIFIRGSVIRYIVLPDDVDTVLLQDSCRRAHKKEPTAKDLRPAGIAQTAQANAMMSESTGASVHTLLQSHTSVRHYVNNPLPRETVERLVKSAQCAASSSFRQAYSIVWVTDTEKRASLDALASNQGQYATADAAFVVCVDFKRLHKCCELAGVDMKVDSAENLLVGVVDAALFAQNLTVAAEAEGYGVCYIGNVRTHIADVSELLALPDLVFPLFGLTLGVPAAGAVNEVKPRLPVEAVLHENSYDVARYDELLPAYDATMAEYYATRSSGAKSGLTAAFTGEIAKSFIKINRPHIREFLASKGYTFA